MSAIRDPDDYDDRRRRRTERDVPVWMMLVIVFLGAVALSLLGVYLLFNFSKPRMYTVPNIRGLATAEARGVTDKMHLRLVVGSTVPNERVEQDHVVDVSPPPGSRIREGGQLTVTLSAGSKLVEVPNLKGMTPDKARSVLSTLHLNLYPPLDTTDDPSVGAGAIARQTPAPQTKVDRDTTVRVTTSTGVAAKPPPDAVPESPRNTYHVVVTLKDLVSATDVRVEMTDDNGTSVLHDEVHQPDDVIDLSPEGQGKKVVFRIFYNDKLVKVQQETAPEAANNR